MTSLSPRGEPFSLDWNSLTLCLSEQLEQATDERGHLITTGWLRDRIVEEVLALDIPADRVTVGQESATLRIALPWSLVIEVVLETATRHSGVGAIEVAVARSLKSLIQPAPSGFCRVVVAVLSRDAWGRMEEELGVTPSGLVVGPLDWEHLGIRFDENEDENRNAAQAEALISPLAIEQNDSRTVVAFEIRKVIEL